MPLRCPALFFALLCLLAVGGPLAAATGDELDLRPEAGTYERAVTVVMQAHPQAGTIYFTLDGSAPTPASLVYTRPFRLSDDATVRAVLVADDGSVLAEVTHDYVIEPKGSVLAVPTFDPPSGTYTEGQAVTLASADGATIHYTTDGSLPDRQSPVFSEPIPVEVSGTMILAFAAGSGGADSGIVQATYLLAVAEPVLDPAPGSFTSPPTITATSTTPEVEFRYTVDGSDPLADSPLLPAEGLELEQTTELRVVGFREGFEPSPVAGGVYELVVPAAEIGLAGGTYHEEQMVSVTGTPEATYRYTLDGSIPTASSPAVPSAGVAITESATLQVRGFRSGWTPSPVVAATYELQALAPSFDPVAGSYSSEQAVTLSSATADAEVRFTRDGSDPIASSELADGPVTVDVSQTLTARAFRSGWTPSEPASASYQLIVPDPTIDLAAGTYTDELLVPVTVPTGATSHYTLDGSAPTASSPTVSAEGVAITESATLSVIALRAGWTDSAVVSAAYELQVAAPVLDPVPGTYHEARTVLASTTSPGASLHYTLDGNVPDAASPEVPAGGVLVEESATLQVVGIRTGWGDSLVVGGSYTIQASAEPVATPVLSIPGGTYSDELAVTASTTTAEAELRYTLDGTTPTETSPLVPSSGVAVTTSATLLVVGFHPERPASDAASAIYELQVATPTLDPETTNHLDSVTVTATSSSPGATLRYTLDGSDPDVAASLFPVGGLTLTDDAEVRVRGFRDGWAASAVASRSYVVEPSIAAPVLTFAQPAVQAVESSGTLDVALVLDAPAPAEVAVTIRVENIGEAEDGLDFVGGDYSLTIPAGASAATVAVTLIDDALTEPSERFALRVRSVSGAELGSPSAITATIVDDESPPLARFAATASAVDEDVGTTAIGVTLTHASSSDLVLPIAVVGGSASPADDVTLPVAVTVPAGATAADLVVTVHDDALAESDEVLELAIDSPQADPTASPHSLTIRSDPADGIVPVVSMDAPDLAVAEGLGAAPIGLSVDPVSGQDLVVTLAYEDLGATGHLQGLGDYRSDRTRVIVPAGTANVDLQLPITADALPEEPERVRVVLAEVAGAEIGSPAATELTILDDDPGLVTLTLDGRAIAGVEVTRLAEAVTLTLGEAPAHPASELYLTLTTDGSLPPEPVASDGTPHAEAQLSSGSLILDRGGDSTTWRLAAVAVLDGAVGPVARAEVHLLGQDGLTDVSGAGGDPAVEGSAFTSATSTTSPYQWELHLPDGDWDDLTISVQIDGAQVPVQVLDRGLTLAEVPLDPTGPATATVTVIDGGGTSRSHDTEIEWGVTDLAADPVDRYLRAGDALLLASSAGSELTVDHVDPTGATEQFHLGVGDRLPVAFKTPGVHRLESTAGAFTVTVVGPVLTESSEIPAQVSFTRDLAMVGPTGLHYRSSHAERLQLIGGDPDSGSYEDVSAVISVTPLKPGTAHVLARLGATGPIVGMLPVTGFEADFEIESRGVIDGESWSVVRTEPAVEGLSWRTGSTGAATPFGRHPITYSSGQPAILSGVEFLAPDSPYDSDTDPDVVGGRAQVVPAVAELSSSDPDDRILVESSYGPDGFVEPVEGSVDILLSGSGDLERMRSEVHLLPPHQLAPWASASLAAGEDPLTLTATLYQWETVMGRAVSVRGAELEVRGRAVVNLPSPGEFLAGLKTYSLAGRTVYASGAGQQIDISVASLALEPDGTRRAREVSEWELFFGDFSGPYPDPDVRLLPQHEHHLLDLGSPEYTLANVLMSYDDRRDFLSDSPTVWGDRQVLPGSYEVYGFELLSDDPSYAPDQFYRAEFDGHSPLGQVDITGLVFAGDTIYGFDAQALAQAGYGNSARLQSGTLTATVDQPGLAFALHLVDATAASSSASADALIGQASDDPFVMVVADESDLSYSEAFSVSTESSSLHWGWNSGVAALTRSLSQARVRLLPAVTLSAGDYEAVVEGDPQASRLDLIGGTASAGLIPHAGARDGAATVTVSGFGRIEHQVLRRFRPGLGAPAADDGLIPIAPIAGISARRQNLFVNIPLIAHATRRPGPDLMLSYNSQDGMDQGWGPGWRTNYDQRVHAVSGWAVERLWNSGERDLFGDQVNRIVAALIPGSDFSQRFVRRSLGLTPGDLVEREVLGAVTVVDETGASVAFPGTIDPDTTSVLGAGSRWPSAELTVRPGLRHRDATGAIVDNAAVLWPAEADWQVGERFRLDRDDGWLRYFDGDGRLVRMRNLFGESLMVERDAAGIVTRVVDDSLEPRAVAPADFVELDGDGRVGALRVADSDIPLGGLWEFGYDENGRLDSLQSVPAPGEAFALADGLTTLPAYEVHYQPDSTVTLGGQTLELPDARVQKVVFDDPTTALEEETVFTRDATTDDLVVAHALGGATTFRFGPDGRLAEIEEDLGDELQTIELAYASTAFPLVASLTVDGILRVEREFDLATGLVRREQVHADEEPADDDGDLITTWRYRDLFDGESGAVVLRAPSHQCIHAVDGLAAGATGAAGPRDLVTRWFHVAEGAAAGRLERIERPDGSHQQWSYDSQGLTVGFTDPAGEEWVLQAHTPYGDATILRHANASPSLETEIGYATARERALGLTGTTVERIGGTDVARQAITYDGRQRPVFVEEGGAEAEAAADERRFQRLAYTPRSLLRSSSVGPVLVTAADGTTTTSDAEPTTTTRTDVFGRERERQVPGADDPVVTTYQRVSTGWSVATTQGTLDGGTSLIDFGGRLRQREIPVWRSAGTVTPTTIGYAYHPTRGHLEAITGPDGITTLEIDLLGNIERIDTPAGTVAAPTTAVTRIETNALGWRVAVTDPDGRTTQSAYDPLGRVQQTSNERCVTARIGYEGRGLPTLLQPAVGAKTTQSYHPDGDLEQRQLPDGSQVAVTRAGRSRTRTLTAANGDAAALTALGNLLRLPSETTLACGGETLQTQASWHPLTETAAQVANPLRDSSGVQTDTIGRTTGSYRTGIVGGAEAVIADARRYDASLGGLPSQRELPTGLVGEPVYDPVTGAVIATRDNRDGTERIVSRILERDASGRVLAWAQITGVTEDGSEQQLITRQTFDRAGNRISLRTPGEDASSEDRFVYSLGGLMLSQRRNGREIVTGYNDLGLRRSLTVDGELEQEWRYNAAGELISTTVDGETTRFIRHPELRYVTRTIGPIGTIDVHWHFETDSVNDRATIAKETLGPYQGETPPSDVRRIVEHFDELGRRVCLELPDGDCWEWRYNLAGDQVERIDPGGRSTTYAYDGSGRRVCTEHHVGDATTTVAMRIDHDLDLPGLGGSDLAFGMRRARTVVDADGTTQTVANTFDRGSRLIAAEWADQAAFLIDPDLADRAQRRGPYQLTYFQTGDTTPGAIPGRLASFTDTRAGGGTAEVRYVTGAGPSRGRLAAVSLPNGLERSYGYDDEGRLANLVETIGGVEVGRYELAYDESDRLVLATEAFADRHLERRSTYDAEGRLIAEDLTVLAGAIDPEHRAYELDANANRIGERRLVSADALADAAVTFPQPGTQHSGEEVLSARLILRQEPETALGGTGAVSSGLSAGGVELRARTTFDDADGSAVSHLVIDGVVADPEALAHARDAELVLEASYGLGGTVVARLWVGGQREADELLASAALNATPTELVLISDAEAVLTALPPPDDQEPSWAAYPELAWRSIADADQLTEITYAYDPYDRLLSRALVAGTESRITTYAYDANDRLTDTATTDGLGNPIDSRHYDYDRLDRQSAVTDDGVLQAQTDYLADTWLRASITTGGGLTTSFTYDENGQLLSASEAGTTRRYAYHGRSPLWELDAANALTAYAKNHRGDVVGLVDAGGLGHTYHYDSWGVISGFSATGQSLADLSAGPRYRGMWYQGSGLNTYKTDTRTYDPVLGRFAIPDPARAGNNWYAYAGGDPVNRWDPSGLDFVSWERDGSVVWNVERVWSVRGRTKREVVRRITIGHLQTNEDGEIEFQRSTGRRGGEILTPLTQQFWVAGFDERLDGFGSGVDWVNQALEETGDRRLGTADWTDQRRRDFIIRTLRNAHLVNAQRAERISNQWFTRETVEPITNRIGGAGRATLGVIETAGSPAAGPAAPAVAAVGISEVGGGLKQVWTGEWEPGLIGMVAGEDAELVISIAVPTGLAARSRYLKAGNVATGADDVVRVADPTVTSVTPERWRGVQPRQNFYAGTAREAEVAGVAIDSRVPLSAAPAGRFKYVVDMEGNMWVDVAGSPNHSSLVRETDEVFAAGIVQIDEAGNVNVNAFSGHYMQEDPLLGAEAEAFLRAMRETIEASGLVPGNIDAGTGNVFGGFLPAGSAGGS